MSEEHKVEETTCGKVVRYTDVEATPVPKELATGTRIRWLIASGDGARNFYMRLFEMEPGAHIKPHFHPWEHEIFILEGGGKIRIGGAPTRLSPGTPSSYRLTLSTSTGPGRGG